MALDRVRMSGMRTLFLFALSAMLCAGCAQTPPASPDPAPAAVRETPSASPPQSAAGLAGSSWRLASTASAASAPESVPTLTFDSLEHVSGTTSCNRFSGAVTFSGGSMKIGPLMTTRRGCPSAVMEQETRFLRALEASRSYRRAEGALELLDESGAVVLRLAADTDAPRPH